MWSTSYCLSCGNLWFLAVTPSYLFSSEIFSDRDGSSVDADDREFSICAATLMTYFEKRILWSERDKNSQLLVGCRRYSNANVPGYLHFVSFKFCIANQKKQQGYFSKNADPIVDITGNPFQSPMKTEHELTPAGHSVLQRSHDGSHTNRNSPLEYQSIILTRFNKHCHSPCTNTPWHLIPFIISNDGPRLIKSPCRQNTIAPKEYAISYGR